jgi:hypothetical protein
LIVALEPVWHHRDLANQTRCYADLVGEVTAVAHQTALQRKPTARIRCEAKLSAPQ